MGPVLISAGGEIPLAMANRNRLLASLRTPPFPCRTGILFMTISSAEVEGAVRSALLLLLQDVILSARDKLKEVGALAHRDSRVGAHIGRKRWC
jgi:hypothetical protein